MRLNRVSFAVLCVGLVVALPLFAQGTTGTTTANEAGAGAKPARGATKATGGSLDSTDRKFMEKAAMGGLAEVDMAYLAKEKGLHEEVKEFASRMATDHTQANDQLKALAAARGVQLPTALDKRHQKESDKLRKPIGPDFDRAYMKRMVSDHETDVKAFRHEAKSGKDEELRSFAASKVPVLEGHLRMARVTRDIVQGSKRTGDRETGSEKK